MAVKKQARPVKPLPAEQVRPEKVWSLERFSERAERQAMELDEQVLAQMRTALQPKLDEEIARLKAEAEAAARETGYQTGFEAGKQAGYEAGYQAGLAAAEAEIVHFRDQAAALISALQSPLAAWDEAVTEQVFRIIRESLARFMVSDVEGRVALMAHLLAPVLRQMREQAAPITVVAHPDTVARLKPRLEEDVTWQTDPELPATSLKVHQDVSEVVLDWQRLMENYLADLERALQDKDHDTPADTSPDSQA